MRVLSHVVVSSSQCESLCCPHSLVRISQLVLRHRDACGVVEDTETAITSNHVADSHRLIYQPPDLAPCSGILVLLFGCPSVCLNVCFNDIILLCCSKIFHNALLSLTTSFDASEDGGTWIGSGLWGELCGACLKSFKAITTCVLREVGDRLQKLAQSTPF